MSGIVGIVNFDGAPIDGILLCRMTDAMGFRGPDAKQTWNGGCAGFGFTLLRTTDESGNEKQPITFDGNIWIVADARIDGRSDLVSKLNEHGRDATLKRPDVELILHAHAVWGADCVEHLIGDFAFAIWDSAKRTLFCARDQMGVKPFYYAQADSSVIFSNTLDCIRLYPGISNRRCELAIADYLLFECNRHRDLTFFQEIHRLVPAHTATWASSGLKLRRYWTLPIDEPIQFRNLSDYTDRFNELLREAVSDRLRTSNVGVWMSGGLDSSSLAATANQEIRGRSNGRVHAFTWVVDGIDQERRYAGLVAKHLDIPIHFRDLIAEGIDADWERGAFHTVEPPANPLILERDRSYYQHVSSISRVALYGEGPDAALSYEWKPYLMSLVNTQQWFRLVSETARHLALHRRLPLLSTIPRAIRERKLEGTWSKGYPIWLNPDFERRLDLPARWEANRHRMPVHPTRPIGYASVMGAQWPSFFEYMDAETTEAPLEFRHPYFDTRLLRFLLAVPAIPWCRVKYLIRRSMRGLLPQPVLERPKAPIDPDPWAEFTRTAGYRPLIPGLEFRQYVSPERVAPGPPQSLGEFRDGLRPRSLNYWLTNADRLRNNGR